MPSILPTPSNDYLIQDDTPLDPPTLNAVFTSISQRLTSLLELTAGFADAVSEAAIALADGRLQESVAPSITALNTRVAEITALLTDAEDRIAAIQAGGVLAENVTLAEIAGLDAEDAQAALAELVGDIDAVAAAAAGDVSALSTRVNTLETAKAVFYRTYENRGELRTIEGPADKMALVEGLGLFVWVSGSNQPDDDETALASSTGVWLLEAVSWDAAYAYWLPDIDVLRSAVEGIIILGTAVCSLSTISPAQGADFTATVVGAVVGDPVSVNPPGPLETSTTGRLTYHAWVSAADIVTIRIVNPSASSGTLNAAVTGPSNPWRVAIIRGV